jgi:hypothetical protein
VKALPVALLLALGAGEAAAQIDFKAGDVQVRQRALKPDDVRRFIEQKNFKAAKEVALQCFKETKNAWCEYYAGQLTYGAPGLESNEAEGLRLIRSAAAKNVSSAQVFIGNLHFNGMGVEKSAAQAVSWWERGARNCNAWAQNALARVYYDGEVIKKDLEAAYYWITLAAYYRFPNSDQGVDVVGADLSADAKKAVEARAKRFTQTSRCGDSPDKPVVHDQWSE